MLACMNKQAYLSILVPTHESGIIIRWLPTLLWSSLIFALSHQPKETLAPLQPSTIMAQPEFMLFGMDADTLLGKSAHMLLFAVLGMLLYRATRHYQLTVLLALVYAGLDEWHQAFVPGRTPRLSDIGFDLAGVLFVLLIIRVGVWLWRQHLHNKRLDANLSTQP